MARYQVKAPDGSLHVIEGPDGATPEQITAAAQQMLSAGMTAEDTSVSGKVVQGAKNLGAGLVRGAGSIGATILYPLDKATDLLMGDRGPNVTGLVKGKQPLSRNEERRQAMDAGLREMGADTNSLLFKGGEIATEIGATMPIGGVVGKVVGKVAPRLGQAISTGGMSTGQGVLPTLGAKAGDMGIRMAGGAINGGLSAGAVNQNESGAGSIVGALLPPAVRGVGAVGNALGAVVSSSAAKSRAVNKLAEVVGAPSDMRQIVADIQTHYPKGAENIPLSAAAITKNPQLAQLEQGSRLNASPAWFDFDQKHGRAVWDNVSKATSEAEEIGTRAAARRDNWQQAWEAASESQKPRIWAKRMGQLGGDIQQAMTSPEASNPAVRNVLQAIYDEVVRVGPGFSPAHLQQLRANLSGKVQPMSPDVFKSAPRDSAAVKSLIAEMDDILNASTGGKWQKVIEGYAKDSEKLHQAKAAEKVRGAFIDRETGRVQGTALADDVPKVTEAGLGRAMNAARLPDKSLALSSEANQQLEATVEALRRQNVVQQLKKAATAGGGSDTIPNAIAAGAAHASGAPNMLMQVVGAVKKMGTAKTDNALAALLSNPDELAAALERYMGPRRVNPLALAASRSVPAIASGQ